MSSDYYKILGVEESADLKQIKRAYRKLAKRYHPDRHKGDKKAESRFKEISEAYATISDQQKRQEYDMMRKYGAGSPGMYGGPTGGFQGFPGGKGFDFSQFQQREGGGRSFSFQTNGNLSGMGDLSDILSSLMGGGGGQSGKHSGFGSDTFSSNSAQPSKGADITVAVTITFNEAVNGTVRMLTLRGGVGKKIKVKVPAGIDNNGKIRLRGMGQNGILGGRKGDLIIKVRVMPDKQFERKGNDIFSSVEISFIEAIKGCKIQVKTLTRTVSLSIPPGTQPGTKMRLKEMGLAVSGKTGDQYVEIRVIIPSKLSENQKKLIDEWEG